jgi:hypothetical protein
VGCNPCREPRISCSEVETNISITAEWLVKCGNFREDGCMCAKILDLTE